MDPVTRGVMRGATLFGFLKAWRRNRKEKKAERRALDEVAESFNSPDEELPAMDKLLQLLAAYSASKRTSTKQGAAGLVIPGVLVLLASWPLYDHIKAFIVQACAQPEPADFIVAGAVGWIVTLVTTTVAARLSKTPANPGKL